MSIWSIEHVLLVAARNYDKSDAEKKKTIIKTNISERRKVQVFDDNKWRRDAAERTTRRN